MREIPLGQTTGYAAHYDPGLLYPVARSDARTAAGIGPDLPFHGSDIWNAWELTWLNENGKPVVATAEFRVDAASTNIIESKSLKLYLNSFAMTRAVSAEEIAASIRTDLSRCAGGDVVVIISTAAVSDDTAVSQFPGTCIDDLDLMNPPAVVDASSLQCDDTAEVDEELHTHLLRSNCPVTNQPDMGSVLVRYRGPKIDRLSLLRYIVSYRQHNDFHEACVERIFLDIKKTCLPRALTVYARYNRRGGLDINPFRTDTDEVPENSRLWRQ